MEKLARIISIFLRIMAVFLEGFCLSLAFLNYKTIKFLGDLLSKDKNFQSLTPSLVASLRVPALVLGILTFIVGLAIFLWPRKVTALIERILGSLRENGALFFRDCRLFFQSLWFARPSKYEAILLAGIVVLAGIARWILINRPIEYDEAYTYSAFAQYSFRYIVSTYYVPNNHVFHTILVHFFTQLLGDAAWKIRLTSFLASLLLIISLYYLGRALYDKKIGIAAAILLGFFPSVTLRSVSARGYVLMTLFFVLGLLLADYVIRHKNKAAWVFLILICALGFYTVPTMLFPAGMIFIWIAASGIAKETSHEYRNFANLLKYLIVAGFSILILTLLFYSPILLANNLQQVYVNNRVLQALPLGKFIASIPSILQSLLKEMMRGMLWPILVVLAVGIILSFFVHKRVSKYRLPTQLIFIVSLTFVMILERPSYPIARIWLWIYPLLALWCAAGFVGSLQWLEERFSIRRLTSLVLAITLGGFLVFGMRQAYIMLVQKVGVEDPVAEQVTQFLKPRLTADDLVLVSRCSDARYWYYFHHYGIPDVIGNRNRFFTKMYIIAYIQANPSCGNEDVKNVFSIYGPDSVFFDLKTLHIVKQFDYAAIYEMDPILQRIQKAYPNH